MRERSQGWSEGFEALLLKERGDTIFLDEKEYRGPRLMLEEHNRSILEMLVVSTCETSSCRHEGCPWIHKWGKVSEWYNLRFQRREAEEKVWLALRLIRFTGRKITVDIDKRGFSEKKHAWNLLERVHEIIERDKLEKQV